MCQRRSILVASTSLLLVALFNHCMALTVSIERQAPSAPNLVPDNLSSAPTSRPCSSCAPKTATSPSSSTVSSSSTRSNPDDSTTPHSDSLVQHYERQLLNHFGLKRRPPARKSGTVDAISDHMHSLYKRFSENDEWEDFVWIAGDRRKELGRLTSVRTHPLSDLTKSSDRDLRFDLSSVVSTEDERPIAGELRLFLNLSGPPGVHEVAVYDVMPRRGGPPLIHRLHTRHIKAPSVAWRSFDISPALVRWSRRPRWRQTGEGRIRLRMKRPRRLRRSVDPNASPNKADWRGRHAELFSYYQNSKKREKRRHRKRKKNRNQNRRRKRNRKRNRERRRRRKIRRYNNVRTTDRVEENKGYYSSEYWSDDSVGGGRHEKRNAMVAPNHDTVCQRRSMYVDFAEVGWNNWIVAPQGYHAGLCYGSCEPQVLSKNFNTTNHAIIQSHFYRASAKVPPPCCVAVELSAKPILLLNENRNVILKNYEEMIVDTCGCR